MLIEQMFDKGIAKEIDDVSTGMDMGSDGSYGVDTVDSVESVGDTPVDESDSIMDSDSLDSDFELDNLISDQLREKFNKFVEDTDVSKVNEYSADPNSEVVRLREELNQLKSMLSQNPQYQQNVMGGAQRVQMNQPSINEVVKQAVNTLPKDADGNVFYNNEWMTPDYAEVCIKTDLQFKIYEDRINQLESMLAQTANQSKNIEIVETFVDAIAEARSKVFPNDIPEKGKEFIDTLIAQNIVGMGMDSNGRFNIQKAMQSIPQAVKTVRDLLGMFGNLQIQNNVNKPSRAAVSSADGGVVLPGQKSTHELTSEERERLAIEAARKAVEMRYKT